MSMTPPGAEPGDPQLPPPPSDTAPPAPSPAFGTQPPPAFGTQPPPTFGTQPPPTFGTQPPPTFGTQPPPTFGTQPPPGYVSYNQAGGYLGAVSLATTTGLRKWASGLFVLVTALAGVSAWAQIARVGVVDDFISGTATIFDIDDADNLVLGALFTQIAALVAAGIVLCIWTLRTVRNAEQLVGDGLKPRLAAGGWFIPIGNLWVSFAKLRGAARPLQGRTSNISWWQGLWIAGTVFGTNIGRDPFEQATIEGVRDALSSAANRQLLSTAILAAATFFAIRAMRDMETAIRQRHERGRSA